MLGEGQIASRKPARKIETACRWLVRFSKFKRLLAAVPIADLLATVVAVAAVITIGASIVGGSIKPETLLYLKFSETVAWILLVVFAVILASKTWLEYQRRVYDPSMIWTFQKEFDALEDKRKEAAIVCLEFLRSNSTERDETKRWAETDLTERIKVEPILDCFEDVGFYLAGDQFSDMVAHHNFFHWIRGWYCILAPYIEYYQITKGERSAYIHIEKLFWRTAEIERRCSPPQLLLTNNAQKIEFLREEGGDGDVNVSANLSVSGGPPMHMVLTISAANLGETPVSVQHIGVLLSKASMPFPQGISKELAAKLNESLVSSEISPTNKAVVELPPHGGQHRWTMTRLEFPDFEKFKDGETEVGRGYLTMTSGRKIHFNFTLIDATVWRKGSHG
jgi:hypothetical protein